MSILPENTKPNEESLHATTRFADDGEVAEAESFVHNYPDDITVKDMNIVKFLEKPLNYFDVPWGLVGTHPRGYLLTSFDPIAVMLTNTLWASKIDGFNLFRGTACVKVTLNANPFQQGQLLLSFLPGYTTMNNFDTSYGGMHASNATAWPANLSTMTSATMQPHIVADCRDSSAIMKIPYITPYSHYDVKNGDFSFGTFFLRVLSPLATGLGGESTVDVTLWLWWEDVELAAPLVPQSSVEPKKKRVVAVTDRERKTVGANTISDMLSKTSRAAKFLGEVPIIGSYITSLSWITRALSKASSVFGFSKPLSLEKPDVMLLQFDRYGATCDGVDFSLPLGVSSTNEVKYSTEMSCRNDDEMSLAFLLKQEALVQVLTWTDSQTVGTPVLSAKTLSPVNLAVAFSTTVTGHTATLTIGPPVYYFSNIFRFWRGSIRVRFVFVKTEFHTGRLMFTWTPVSTVGTAIGNVNSSYSLREIVDIRQGDEVCFDFPYLLPENYIQSNTYSGKLDILVVNELRHPETANANIEILMYASAGDDFEYQVPYGLPFSEGSIIPMSLQSNEIVCGVIGGYPRKKRNYCYAADSIGESCHSIKQLLARNSPIYQSTTVTNQYGITVWPWLAACVSNVGAASPQAPNSGGDLYSFLSPMYAYFRGPVRVKFQSVAAGVTYKDTPIVASTDIRPSFIGSNVITASSAASLGASSSYSWSTNYNVGGAQGFSVDNCNGMGQYVVPYYCQTKFSALYHQYNNNLIPVEDPTVNTQPRTTLSLNSFDLFQSQYNLFRSFPEDFQLGYFIGCPPLLFSFA